MKTFYTYALTALIIGLAMSANAQDEVTTFKAGEVIKAEEMNANFAVLQARISELEAMLDDTSTPHPAGSGYLGSFQEIVTKDDDFYCVPWYLELDSQDERCASGQPLPGFPDYRGYARYISHPLIDGNPNLHLLVQPNYNDSSHPQAEIIPLDDIFQPNDPVFFFEPAYDDAQGQWYIFSKSADFPLGCHRTDDGVQVCKNLALDFLVFEK